MFVKLSGDKWVNTGNVCEIHKETRQEDTSHPLLKYRVVYVVWFAGDNNKMVLNETQGLELLASIEQTDGGTEIADGVLMREAATILDTNDFSGGKSLEDVGVTEPHMIDAVVRVMRMRGTR